MPEISEATPSGEGGQPGGWVSLDSRSISSVAFDSTNKILKVHFVDGDTWGYKNVPLVKYKTLIYHGSSGAYLRKEIIPHHEASKINDGPPRDS